MKTHNHEVKTHAHQVAEETKALLAATAEATEDTVVQARNRLRSALEATTETYERVKEQAIAGAKATDKMVRANPWQTAGIAFGVGALVGYLWSRRSRE